ncbi:MAG TPA: serine protease [Oligoflexus sp.]|uniref:S1 family peptidase n=1 Tax=Oligoflexus sp. TaxID=1971216 RepID=UPI002D7E20B3|nr:serine protease [Oligoflexus sp.]HET9236685.1 serine protease [Oligoflexus sp.]
MWKKIGLFISLALAFGSVSHAQSNPIKKTFQYSVVEVLIDRPKDDQAELNRPIPLQKIPFKQRTDKFISIGTAWFINDKELFSAAHVFPANFLPFTQNFYVRTIFGEVFPVDAVTLYSNRFDIISFTLKAYPKRVVPISVVKTYAIGDDVCVPGNALGQGISLRCGGQISSLAPEPRNGEWKEIFFSTPVSPGNSGGPLIDAGGRALGIVVRKIQGEDLNIATPFNELTKLKTRLEYVEKDLGFQNKIVQPLYAKSDLSIGSNQPMPLMDWLRLLAAGTNDHLLKMARAYENSWLKNGVMTSRPARNYYRNPRKGSFFTQVKFVNQDLSLVDGDEGELEKYRKTKRRVILQRIAEKPLFFISRNRGERLDALLNNPKELMNSVLSTGRVLSRKIVDEELFYTSLGQPSLSTLITDLQGRNWIMHSWKLNEIETTAALLCTPRPSDVACFYHTHESLLTPETVAAMFRVDISELTLSYAGSSSDWVEFLGPANRLRPAFMAGVSILRADGKVRIAAQELSIASPGAAAPGGNDSIVMTFSPDPMNPLRQTAYAVSYIPNLAERIIVSAMKVYKAGSTAAEMNAWAASGGIFRTKGGKYMAARLIDQKNSNVAFMGYMYGDEEKKLNRFWKSIEFRVNAPVALVDRN